MISLILLLILFLHRPTLHIEMDPPIIIAMKAQTYTEMVVITLNRNAGTSDEEDRNIPDTRTQVRRFKCICVMGCAKDGRLRQTGENVSLEANFKEYKMEVEPEAFINCIIIYIQLYVMKVCTPLCSSFH